MNMKTPNSLFVRHSRFHAPLPLRISSLVAAMCLVSGAMFAADAASVKKEVKKVKPAQAKSGSEEKVVVTGSLIPQKGPLNRIPVTTSPVVIIDQKDIQRSGGTTVAEVLRRQVSSR